MPTLVATLQQVMTKQFDFERSNYSISYCLREACGIAGIIN